MSPQSLLAAVLLGAGACTCGPAAQRPAPLAPADMSTEATQQLPTLSAHPSLELVIRTGIPSWKAGEVTLRVRGDGLATVTRRQDAETTSFEATLRGDELDAFGQALHAHKFTARRTSKLPREPGDTPLVLALHRDSAVAFETSLWEADRDTDPDLDAILRAAEKLVARVSGDKLGSAP